LPTKFIPNIRNMDGYSVPVPLNEHLGFTDLDVKRWHLLLGERRTLQQQHVHSLSPKLKFSQAAES
jgi:hypothetical protein